MTSHLGSKSVTLSLKHHFCEVNDEGQRSMQSHLKEKAHFFPRARYFLDGLFLTADLMEGEPLCRSSAAVKAVAACGGGRICFRSFSSSKQAELSLQQMFHHRWRGGKKRIWREGEARDLLQRTISSDLELRQKKQHTDEILEFKMSTRSLGIIETIQLCLMCKNNNKSDCDRLFPGNGLKNPHQQTI